MVRSVFLIAMYLKLKHHKNIYVGPFTEVGMEHITTVEPLIFHGKPVVLDGVVTNVPENAHIISPHQWGAYQQDRSPVDARVLSENPPKLSDAAALDIIINWAHDGASPTNVPWSPGSRQFKETPGTWDCGLRLTESAYQQLNLCAVHLLALYAGGVPAALTMAKSLLYSLDRLAATAYTIEGAPETLHAIGADRSYLGFSFCEHKLGVVEGPTQQKLLIATRDNREIELAYYNNRYNGGIIYHGPGQGQNYSVQLDDSFMGWSTHT